MRPMAGTKRKLDRARRLAREALQQIGNEIRQARLAVGLSQAALAGAVGISQTGLSWIERGLAPHVSVEVLATLGTAVGLDLSLRVFSRRRADP